MQINHAALRAIRERTEVTQTEVARLANIDRSNYANIEAGRKRATPAQIKAFARVLAVPVTALLAPYDDGAAA